MNDRTAFLLRQSAGRVRLTETLAELSTAFGRPILAADWLALEDGDRLRAAVMPQRQAARATGQLPAFSRWSVDGVTRLRDGLAALGHRLADDAIYLVPIVDDHLGALPVDPARDFGSAPALARLAWEECTMSTASGHAGLWLEYQASEAQHGSRCPYELTLWGEAWLRIATDVIPFEHAAPEA